MEGSKVVEGRIQTWCTTCERRILQLAALHERRSTHDDISDEQLLQLVRTRLRPLSHAIAAIRKATNVVCDAVKRGEIPSVKIATMILVPLRSAEAWRDARDGRLDVHRKVLAVLPKTDALALRPGEIADRAGVSANAVREWLYQHRNNPQIRREGGTTVHRYWWHEEPQ